MSAAPHIKLESFQAFYSSEGTAVEYITCISCTLKMYFYNKCHFFLQGKFNILPFLWLSCCCSENKIGEGSDAYSANMWYFLQSTASTQHVFLNKIHGGFNGHNYSLVLWLMWVHFLQQLLEGRQGPHSSLFSRLMPENVRNAVCPLHLLLLLTGQSICWPLPWIPVRLLLHDISLFILCLILKKSLLLLHDTSTVWFLARPQTVSYFNLIRYPQIHNILVLLQ